MLQARARIVNQTKYDVLQASACSVYQNVVKKICSLPGIS